MSNETLYNLLGKTNLQPVQILDEDEEEERKESELQGHNFVQNPDLFTRRCLIPLNSQNLEQVARKLSLNSSDLRTQRITSLAGVLASNQNHVGYYQYLSQSLLERNRQRSSNDDTFLDCSDANSETATKIFQIEVRTLNLSKDSR